MMVGEVTVTEIFVVLVIEQSQELYISILRPFSASPFSRRYFPNLLFTCFIVATWQLHPQGRQSEVMKSCEDVSTRLVRVHLQS